jgi:transposase
MAANDRQVRKLFRAHERGRNITFSALAAGLCRQTAAKYLKAGNLPSELARPHTWRTRPDPFAAVQAELAGMLSAVPDLPATAALAYLQHLHPGGFADGQLRTLQRQFRQHRARTLAQEVFFAQEHKPGEWLQIDWTDGSGLGVTIRGKPFAHLLAHAVFPFSNWEWATVCHSESFASLLALVRETANRAGGLPQGLQTDNSCTVTHRIESGRAFNAAYAGFLARYGLQARTINLGCPNEDGDVESAHRHFRRQVKVALGFRGSRDFDSVDEYTRFLIRLLCGCNATRQAAWAEERERLRPVPEGGIPDQSQTARRVDPGSLVTVDAHAYSVPPSYIGEELRCRVGWERIEFWHGTMPVRDVVRVWGEEQGVQWRDLVKALSHKPGAFAAYRYRDAFFPTPESRALYGQLTAARGPERADRDWLGLLLTLREVPDEQLAAVLRCTLNTWLGSGAMSAPGTERPDSRRPP